MHRCSVIGCSFRADVYWVSDSSGRCPGLVYGAPSEHSILCGRADTRFPGPPVSRLALRLIIRTALCNFLQQALTVKHRDVWYEVVFFRHDKFG